MTLEQTTEHQTPETDRPFFLAVDQDRRVVMIETVDLTRYDQSEYLITPEQAMGLVSLDLVEDMTLKTQRFLTKCNCDWDLLDAFYAAADNALDERVDNVTSARRAGINGDGEAVSDGE